MSEEGNNPEQPAASPPAAAGSAVTRIEGWIRVALVASLGANIFLGGFIAARMLGPKPPPATPEIVDLNLRGLPQGLSSEVREELEDSMRSYRREIRHAYREYRDQQREINRLLVEERLNEPAIAEAHEHLRALNARIQGPIQRALIDAMKQMDAKTRRQMIELRQVSRKRRFGRPRSVDGSRWRFEWHDDDGFHLEMEDRDMIVKIQPGLILEEDPEGEKEGQ